MIDYDFGKSVGYWVGATSHALEQAIAAELTPKGITLRQVQVLSCLVLYGDLVQTELAERLGIEPSTLVRVLDRMARKGWIERREAPDDRRKKVIRPTGRVAPRWKDIVAVGERMETRATKGLRKQQLRELNETLSVIRRNLGAE